MAVLYGKFKMPEKIQVEESSSTFARFVIAPLERGFGHTLGNAMRRILLSSIESPGILSLRIDSVLHEFMASEGIIQDATDIVLNCKEALLRRLPTGDSPPRITRSITEIDVTQEDLDINNGVFHVCLKHLDLNGYVCINPNLCLLSVTKPQKREISVCIGIGRGYVLAERHAIEDIQRGEIILDTCFSPVRLVNYYVENTRVGQDTEFDSLVMEITTDGRITPVESLLFSAQVAGKHFDFFVSQLEGPDLLFDEEHLSFGRPDVDELMACLATCIEDIEFSVRASNCLKSAQIDHVVELVTKQESELLEYRNFGRKSLSEIKVKLHELGLSLGMDLSPYGITRENCRDIAQAYLEEKMKEKERRRKQVEA